VLFRLFRGALGATAFCRSADSSQKKLLSVETSPFILELFCFLPLQPISFSSYTADFFFKFGTANGRFHLLFFLL